MKQLISDWLLTRKHEPDVQQAKASVAFTEIYPEAKLLSGEGKVLLLTHLYLELRLTLEHAVRAAKADSMATKANPPSMGRAASADVVCSALPGDRSGFQCRWAGRKIR